MQYNIDRNGSAFILKKTCIFIFLRLLVCLFKVKEIFLFIIIRDILLAAIKFTFFNFAYFNSLCYMHNYISQQLKKYCARAVANIYASQG